MEMQCFLWGKNWRLKYYWSNFCDLTSVHRILWLSCMFKQMLGWLASFASATARFSCSPTSHFRFKFIKIETLALEAPKLCNSYRIQSSHRGRYDDVLSACFILVSCFVVSSTMKVKATYSSETSVGFQRTIRCYIQEDRCLCVTLS
jgi:hypothetical protein